MESNTRVGLGVYPAEWRNVVSLKDDKNGVEGDEVDSYINEVHLIF